MNPNIHKTRPTPPDFITGIPKGYVYLGHAGSFVIPSRWKNKRVVGVSEQVQMVYWYRNNFYDKVCWFGEQQEVNWHIFVKVDSELHKLQPWAKRSNGYLKLKTLNDALVKENTCLKEKLANALGFAEGIVSTLK